MTTTSSTTTGELAKPQYGTSLPVSVAALRDQMTEPSRASSALRMPGPAEGVDAAVGGESASRADRRRRSLPRSGSRRGASIPVRRSSRDSRRRAPRRRAAPAYRRGRRRPRTSDHPGPTARRHSSTGGDFDQSVSICAPWTTPSRLGPRKPGHSGSCLAAIGGADGAADGTTGTSVSFSMLATRFGGRQRGVGRRPLRVLQCSSASSGAVSAATGSGVVAHLGEQPFLRSRRPSPLEVDAVGVGEAIDPYDQEERAGDQDHGDQPREPTPAVAAGESRPPTPPTRGRRPGWSTCRTASPSPPLTATRRRRAWSRSPPGPSARGRPGARATARD